MVRTSENENNYPAAGARDGGRERCEVVACGGGTPVFCRRMLQLDLFSNLFGLSPKKKTSVTKRAPAATDLIVLTEQIQVHIKRRAYQRKWNLTVLANGRVQVTCSRTSSERALKKWLMQMLPWIEKAQRNAAKAREKFPEKMYTPGELFSFLGQELRLQFRPQSPAAILIEAGILQIKLEPDSLRSLKAAAVVSLYKKAARTYLTERTAYWSDCMGLCPTRLSFRGQKTRWGSCGANGTISLNWKLMAGPEDVVDYVIIHELAHLRHHNHSKAFWQLVEAYCPQRRGLSRWLRENQMAFDFLNI